MDYAQSRLQARFSERPGELLWQKLEAAPDPAAALEIARSCGLRRWVAGIAAHADRHEMEVALRARWRECVSELGAWMPGRWQPAVLWTRKLVDLPALCHLVRGGAPFSWMFDDPELQVYARADSTTREGMLRADCGAFTGSSIEGPGREFVPESAGPARIRQAWLDEWRRRWPPWGDTTSLEALARLLDAASRQPASPGRPELARALGNLFRRSVLCPVAAFIYIAFAALDMERLRAGLLRHALADGGITAS